MDIDDIIDSNQPEDISLEYKHPAAEPVSITKELVALANSGGGQLILGIEEDKGEIIEIHDIENPLGVAESIQQTIRECVQPRLPVQSGVVEYNGAKDDWNGHRLLSFSSKSGARIFSFRESGSKIVFPYRLGSTTDYMNGDDVSHFISNGIRPGRAQTEAAVQNDAEDISVDESAGKDSDSSFDLSPNREPPYRFTPGSGGPVTFKDTIDIHNPYSIEGKRRQVTQDELKALLESLDSNFEIHFDDGRFAISQMNASWYGKGIGNFVKSAFSIPERYNGTPPEFELNEHHSEEMVFIADAEFGLLVLHSRNGVRSKDTLGEFSLNFVTDGVPVDTRNFIRFLNQSDYSLGHADGIDLYSEVIRFPKSLTEIETHELIDSRFKGDFVGWAVARNPFYDDPSLLLDRLDDPENRMYTPLTKEKNILCRIGDHHPRSESRRYTLESVWLHNIGPAHGNSHINANVRINW